MTGLTLVGLGPGSWETLTMEAADALRAAPEIYIRSSAHPAFSMLQSRFPTQTIHTFDDLFASSPGLNPVYRGIAARVAELARGDGGVVYAVPGSALIGDGIVPLILKALGEDVPVRVLAGVSYVETVFRSLGVSEPGWIEVLDAAEIDLLARENAVGEVDGSPARLPWRAPLPTVPMVVTSTAAHGAWRSVGRWLSRYYPESHPILLVDPSGRSTPQRTSLNDLAVADTLWFDCAYVPSLTETENVRTFSGLMNLTRTLRAPGGCPWDREQTHTSLKPHLLEEAYEVVDALDSGDAAEICEELGDLLFQVAIHAQVAAEAGDFTIEDIIGGIVTKLIGRHPHVFGDMELESAQDVRHAWETFKQKQKPKRLSVLEQIPRGMPALPQSNLIQKRAAGVGFEWPDVGSVIAKVEEELDELRHEIDRGASADLEREEFGDILFALVSVARHLRIDPEEALRLANRKFTARFQYVESRAAAEGVKLRDLSPERLDSYWNDAKSLGTGHPAS
jgi:tetrapyrrole methylase family protein/MazG family protein